MGGNAWKSGAGKAGGRIEKTGITQWTDSENTFTAYVRVDKPGNLKLWLHLQVPTGKSRLRITLRGKSREIDITGSSWQDYYVGEWQVKAPGYLAIQLTGLTKTGDQFAEVASLKIAGEAVDENTAFVKNNEGNFFYWGRRGPSVHLNYPVPENTTAEWFYNEITVPPGADVMGSYFMANGFAEGYFGIQVNSPTERRILFSVWSPFQTDDPTKIPEDQKIKLLGKGAGVYTGEFGNEGSGGQSYLKFNWRAGTTYKFLLHGQPTANNYTTYTAYFYNPETVNWMLIASFSRPQTNTYLKRLHSFLENFIPETGNISRQVYFGNQWLRTPQGQWLELAEARLTGDNTANKRYRLDYAGGLFKTTFYLKNCGFFNDFTPLKTTYKRTLANTPPQVDLAKLPGAASR
ncbi:hypothetical protein AAE02nite_01960 [Adhaeribacter aerolatus]|uniref:DUF5077 domain-containing protein n=1 Tax=Adhaeribacter aerolatus TaxID=670289 RepID=A0A512AS53_9BACT|nr:hypothetical protein AAE02nite_01960 [Adhaeribacter aerolatus]